MSGPPLPTAPSPPPPVPPPPVPGVLWGPPGTAAPGWPGTAEPPTAAPTRALRELARGLDLYRWVPILSLVTGLISLGALLAAGGSRLAYLSSQGSVPVGAGATGAYSGLSLLAGIIAFVGFIIALLAFFRWRAAVLELRRSGGGVAGPFDGTRSPPAELADSGYRGSLWTMVLALLAVIIGAVVIVLVVLGSLTPTFHPNNGTVTQPTQSQIDSAVTNAIGAAVGLALVVLLLDLLLAHFVTRSLEGFVGVGPRRSSSVDLGQTRLLVLGSVVLSATGVLNLWVGGLGAISLLGPILLIIAVERYRSAVAEQRAALGDTGPTGF